MTATAKTEVVNTAMAHLGEAPFADITQDPPSAALAKVLAQLDGKSGVEMWALSRHPWLCALSYATLSPATRAGNWKWPVVFDLPDTFVKMWTVDGCDVPYEVGTEVVSGAVKKVVRSTQSVLYVAYTEALGFDAYSADLCNVMALQLAARTAGPLQNNYDGALRLAKLAQDALAEAETGEANQWAADAPLVQSRFAQLRLMAGDGGWSGGVGGDVGGGGSDYSAIFEAELD